MLYLSNQFSSFILMLITFPYMVLKNGVCGSTFTYQPETQNPTVVNRKATLSHNVIPEDEVKGLQQIADKINQQYKMFSPSENQRIDLVATSEMGEKINIGTLVLNNKYNTAEVLYFHMNAGEIALFMSAIFLWIGAIWMFLRKYAKACLIESREVRFDHNPKNIESIMVVENANEGVIHNTHNADHQNTLEARRIHLKRLGSMPCLKINTETFQQNTNSAAMQHGLSPVPETRESVDNKDQLENQLEKP